VRSRKVQTRLHTSKAQMNSVVMQMENQLGRRCAAPALCVRDAVQHVWDLPQRASLAVFFAAQHKVTGHVQKSTEVMKMMNKLMKVSEISETMQAMQKEMCKVRRV
jgi:charged multivesicular body protein 3